MTLAEGWEKRHPLGLARQRRNVKRAPTPSIPGEYSSTSHLSGECSKISNGISFPWSLSAFQMAVVHDKWVQRHFSDCCSSLGLMDMSPVGFQSQESWRLIFHVQVLKVGMPFWATNPLLLRKQFSSGQSLSHVQLFVTPWTAPWQAFLSITNSRSLLKLMSSSWWCHPTNSSSVIPFSSGLQFFPESGSFQMSQFFTSGGQSIRKHQEAGMGFMVKLGLRLSYCFAVAFFSFSAYEGDAQLVFKIFFRGNYPIFSYIFCGSVGGGEFRIFLHHCLKLLPLLILFKKLLLWFLYLTFGYLVYQAFVFPLMPSYGLHSKSISLFLYFLLPFTIFVIAFLLCHSM